MNRLVMMYADSFLRRLAGDSSWGSDAAPGAPTSPSSPGRMLLKDRTDATLGKSSRSCLATQDIYSNDKGASVYEVEVFTLDDALNHDHTVLKVDIEGAERNLFQQSLDLKAGPTSAPGVQRGEGTQGAQRRDSAQPLRDDPLALAQSWREPDDFESMLVQSGEAALGNAVPGEPSAEWFPPSAEWFRSSTILVILLVADGVAGAAAHEEKCRADDGGSAAMHLACLLVAVGVILGALAVQVVQSCLAGRALGSPRVLSPTTREVGIQTDAMQVRPYWTMPLHAVRAEAESRGIKNAANQTRMVLAETLIDIDFKTHR